MYGKESQYQKVIYTFYEKMTLATLELLEKGKINRYSWHTAMFYLFDKRANARILKVAVNMFHETFNTFTCVSLQSLFYSTIV